jgi:hypothetical protein
MHLALVTPRFSFACVLRILIRFCGSFVDTRRFGGWEVVNEGDWGTDRGPDPLFVRICCRCDRAVRRTGFQSVSLSTMLFSCVSLFAVPA